MKFARIVPILLWLLSPTPPASAAQDAMKGMALPTTREVHLYVERGRLLRLPAAAAAVFVAAPDVADVQVHAPDLVYVFGKRAGRTTLYAVDQERRPMLSARVTVEHDLEALRALIARIAPGADISARSFRGGIVLEGRVRTPATVDDLERIAEGFLGEKERVVNRLRVDTPTQVSLHVRVAEISREVLRIFGINWDATISPGDFLLGFASGRGFLNAGVASRLTDENGPAGALLGAVTSGDVNINGMLDALEREGLVTILAEPNLTALSGETASFLAGGEFPVPVGVDNNEIRIEFKQFGVSLAFTPTVLAGDRISLRVRPEVSELSENGAIELQNIQIPALATRRAETTVELASGQSFAIGGLISTQTRNNVEKFPFLGDLPVLGPLFRSTRFRRNESELVIIVTPYLVRPVAAARLATPLDGFAPASLLERVLEGRLARAGMPPAPRVAGPRPRLTGPVGFIFE